MDFEKYVYHLSLMNYRETSARERLSTLRLDIHQPMSEFCAFAELLQIFLDEAKQKPASVQEFQVAVKSICITLHDLHEKTQLDSETLTDEFAQEALLVYWSQHQVVDQALSLADKIPQIEDDLRSVMPPDSKQLLKGISDKALLLQAEFDILANPNELDIPPYIVELNNSMRELRKATPGDPLILPKLIDASKHSLYGFRDMAAVKLRHYQNEEAFNALVELLNDEADSIRGWAANSLGYLKNPKAVPALIDCLQQNFRDATYREWIIWALTEIPDERSIDTLITALDQFMIERQHVQNTLPLVDLKIERIRVVIQAIGGYNGMGMGEKGDG